MTYTFRWGKKAVAGKRDPMHTISGLNEDAWVDGWIRDMRAGTPWQLLEAETGSVIRHGIGSRENGQHRALHTV